MTLRMKAIIKKEYVVDKVIGDIKCGDRSLQDFHEYEKLFDL